ncbi:8 TM domain-containing transmembrane protein [Acrasis kona]|uniref:8 TM domain-containing transmembrane protein n=1 Tax=Acrasis kona TaxID=1008807 RepID=A0AAW2ZAH4_9EUKA
MILAQQLVLQGNAALTGFIGILNVLAPSYALDRNLNKSVKLDNELYLLTYFQAMVMLMFSALLFDLSRRALSYNSLFFLAWSNALIASKFLYNALFAPAMSSNWDLTTTVLSSACSAYYFYSALSFPKIMAKETTMQNGRIMKWVFLADLFFHVIEGASFLFAPRIVVSLFLPISNLNWVDERLITLQTALYFFADALLILANMYDMNDRNTFTIGFGHAIYAVLHALMWIGFTEMRTIANMTFFLKDVLFMLLFLWASLQDQTNFNRDKKEQLEKNS